MFDNMPVHKISFMSSHVFYNLLWFVCHTLNLTVEHIFCVLQTYTKKSILTKFLHGNLLRVLPDLMRNFCSGNIEHWTPEVCVSCRVRKDRLAHVGKMGQRGRKGGLAHLAMLGPLACRERR